MPAAVFRPTLLSVLLLPLLASTSCSVGSSFGPALMEAPQVINVSHYDPKERQRNGSSYSPSNLSALNVSPDARALEGSHVLVTCPAFDGPAAALIVTGPGPD